MTPAGAKRSPYTTLFELARGGFGTVELVVRREGSFERAYALKRLLPHLQDEPEIREMFVREARIAGLIRHANVVGVVDIGEDEAGPYLVMEHVEGLSLRDVLRSLDPRDLLPVQVCLRIASQVARGLHAAHEATALDGSPLNIIHRDVSPANILLGFDGTVRISDFGIAKVMQSGSNTRTGFLKGKLSYMSPEQLNLRHLDRRSDLFSLGIVLFEMLSNARLYARQDAADAVAEIREGEVPDIGTRRRDVPDELVGLLLELLAKSREHRPASSLEVAERLDEILGELMASEAVLRLDTFLQEHFAEEERESARRRAASLSNIEATVLAPASEVHASTPGPTSSRDAEQLSPSAWRQSPRRGWIAALLVSVGLAAGAVTLWATSLAGGGAAETSGDRRRAAPSLSARAATLDDLGSEVDIEPTATADDIAPSDAGTPQPQRPRRSRARRRRAADRPVRAPASSATPSAPSDTWWPRED